MKIFAAILLCLFLFAAGYSQSFRPSVSVVGEAKMSVSPDQVVFMFEIETMDKDLDNAKRDNDARTARTLKTFSDLGIADRDIKTDSLTIAPKYTDSNDPRGANVLVGYIVNRRIMATLKNLQKIDTFLSSAIESGVNRVVNISIENSQIRSLREQVRAMAVKNARAKAAEYAKQLGQTIGSAYWIREEGADLPPDGGSVSGGGVGYGVRDFSKNVMVASGSNPYAEQVTFALGQIEIEERIYVIFELKM